MHAMVLCGVSMQYMGESFDTYHLHIGRVFKSLFYLTPSLRESCVRHWMTQEGSVSIGGRLITNFRFAGDIVVNAEGESW